MPTPKIVFNRTVQNVTIAVTRKACKTDGSLSASITGPSPCSNVRQKRRCREPDQHGEVPTAMKRITY